MISTVNPYFVPLRHKASTWVMPQGHKSSHNRFAPWLMPLGHKSKLLNLANFTGWVYPHADVRISRDLSARRCVWIAYIWDISIHTQIFFQKISNKKRTNLKNLFSKRDSYLQIYGLSNEYFKSKKIQKKICVWIDISHT